MLFFWCAAISLILQHSPSLFKLLPFYTFSVLLSYFLNVNFTTSLHFVIKMVVVLLPTCVYRCSLSRSICRPLQLMTGLAELCGPISRIHLHTTEEAAVGLLTNCLRALQQPLLWATYKPDLFCQTLVVDPLNRPIPSPLKLPDT